MEAFLFLFLKTQLFALNPRGRRFSTNSALRLGTRLFGFRHEFRGVSALFAAFLRMFLGVCSRGMCLGAGDLLVISGCLFARFPLSSGGQFFSSDK